MSLSALANLVLHSSSLSANAFFSATAALRFFSKRSSFSTTAASLARASFSTSVAAFNSAVASACLARLGATPRATKWYLCMAWAHMQMALQATEAFSIILGVKSGFVMYL